MEYNELYHWGIKGQRWGVRRYQNPDGSLTPAGKIRYENNSRFRAKIDKQAAENKPKPKTISEMSDDELKTYISRKTAEKQAYMLRNDIANLNPKQVSVGEKFVKKVWEGAISPAIVEAGKKFLTEGLNKMSKKALGDNVVDEMSKLEKEAKKSEYKTKIYAAKQAELNYKNKLAASKKNDKPKDDDKE